jgi:hypothetical protein
VDTATAKHWRLTSSDFEIEGATQVGTALNRSVSSFAFYEVDEACTVDALDSGYNEDISCGENGCLGPEGLQYLTSKVINCYFWSVSTLTSLF